MGSLRAALETIDPLDPIRYDFALSRLGILRKWEQKKAHPLSTSFRAIDMDGVDFNMLHSGP